MSVSIRRLGQFDLADMRKLNVLFGEAFDDLGTYTGEPPTDHYLSSLLSKDHVIALAAVETTTVVGGLVAYELEKFEQARSEIYIYDLAVAAAYRRQGVATALISHLREIALKRGAWVVYVQADYGDEPAIALYQKLGQRENVMHFDIQVSHGHPDRDGT